MLSRGPRQSYLHALKPETLDPKPKMPIREMDKREEAKEGEPKGPISREEEERFLRMVDRQSWMQYSSCRRQAANL